MTAIWTIWPVLASVLSRRKKTAPNVDPLTIDSSHSTLDWDETGFLQDKLVECLQAEEAGLAAVIRYDCTLGLILGHGRRRLS